MHPIENIMQTSMEQIKKMVDVNTVIGNPVITENRTMILPVSKVCLGFLVGGGEYGSMSSVKKAGEEANGGRYPFAGTSAVGMCLTPLSFLTVEEGNVRVLPANQKCITDRMMDMVPQVMKGLDKLINIGIDCLKSGCKAQNKQGQNEKKSGGCGCQADANASTDVVPTDTGVGSDENESMQ